MSKLAAGFIGAVIGATLTLFWMAIMMMDDPEEMII